MATTLLITLGGLPADLATVGTLVIGISMATWLCDSGCLAVSYEFQFLRGRGKAGRRPPRVPDDG